MKKIVIAGGTGYLGRVLTDHFVAEGYQCVVLTRSLPPYSPQTSQIKWVEWDGKSLGAWSRELEGAEAVINLSGRSVNCRYNDRNKLAIFISRQWSTFVLGKALQECQHPPKVWLNSSSATIYRHAEDRPMNEENGELGAGFSVEVCQLWEHTCNAFQLSNTRKILLRTALVLGTSGGVFPELVGLTKWGLGGKMGSGQQMVSWLHEKDFVGAVHWLINNNGAKGVYNLVAPTATSNIEMMTILRRALKIPIGLPSTNWMLNIGTWLKQTEAELVLKSRWVLPTRLLNEGFTFEFVTFKEACQNLLLEKPTV
ncbi:TIGR01777 family oxidoreductase [Runella sp. MFBS21]|uniref:TIGR01777 family oxidoreductase n=1 Tax=Runella sp. MFBS21 TaxID=3034018 RepID=UPI0023F6FA80|nr:TIGR01777 family oxidoreductase [Runella sp. MFBS21]MDF7816053.1 TIGR01777 family oxidoreductase [Runella sp. MFBS21]